MRPIVQESRFGSLPQIGNVLIRYHFWTLLAVSWLFRSPSLLFVELNWDEALYWQIAGDLRAGHAPYPQLWDRKPVGLFLLLSAVQLLFGDSILVLRLFTATAVAASACILSAIGRLLFSQTPAIGPCAGFCLIFTSLRNGGEGSNAELLLAPFALGGMWLALRAMQDARSYLAFGAGLLFGCALQIKQVALFDALAAGIVMLLLPLAAGILAGLRDRFRLGLWMAAGIVLPLGAVIAWYAAIGHLATLVSITFGASLSAIDGAFVGLSDAGVMAGLHDYGLLLFGFLAGLVIVPTARHEHARFRAMIVLGIWITCVATGLVLLRRFADHMFIQLLPVLALGTAATLCLAVRALKLRDGRAVLLLCVGMAIVAAWGGGRFAKAAVETVWQRAVVGIPHWGDRTATIVAALGDRIVGREDIYVVGRLLGVYPATGSRPPTRFPFTLHLWANYSPVDGVAEMTRIVAFAPRFIVVDDLWLKGARPDTDVADPVFAVLDDALARAYVIDGHVGRFLSRGGGFVGGGIGATIYRRHDVPALTSEQRLPTYDPARLN